MKKIINLFITGVAFGAITYLSLITLNVQPNIPSIFNTVSVLVISGLIGVAAFIFQFDQFNWTLSILIHFLITLCLVTIMMLINGWDFSWLVVLMVLSIYIIIWGVLYIQQWSDVKKVNSILHKRNQ